MLSPLEQCIEAIEKSAGLCGKPWDYGRNKEGDYNMLKKPSCRHCRKANGFDTYVLDNGNRVYKCCYCGGISARLAKTAMPCIKLAESRSRKGFDLSDMHIPDFNKLKLIPKPALEWVTYAHTTIPEKSKEAMDDYRQRCLYWLYNRVIDKFCAARGETDEQFSDRAMAVCRAMVCTGRAGMKRISNSQLAVLIKVDEIYFRQDHRNWAKVKRGVDGFMAQWEDDAARPFM